jgi:pimeloyl-ACP methyl ester carboxylesterase
MGEEQTKKPRKAKLENIELAWAEWGAADTPPAKTILAVHGLTANWHAWDTLGPELAGAGYRVIAFDLRGRGESAKPAGPYGIATHADDVVALLDYLKLPQVNLVGHSLGAVIGMCVAAHQPERVRRLVMIDHGMDTRPDVRETISSSLSRLTRTFGSLEEYLDFFRASPVYRRWTPALEAYFTYDALVRPDGTLVSKVLPAAAYEDLEDQERPGGRPSSFHAGLHLPVLILRAALGTLDKGQRGFVLAAEDADLLVERIAGAKLVTIAGVNHYTITLDPPPAVAEEIVKFLDAGR